MLRVIARILLVTLSVALYASAFVFSANVTAQRKQRPNSSAASKAPAATPTPAERQNVEPARAIPKGLVGVPVIVTDAAGNYVSDLKQSDFEVLEDGMKQNVALFQTASEPLALVLLLDTSISTQDKLGDIRRAANAFVDQLQQTDRIKVISFDDQVRELSDFSADRACGEEGHSQRAIRLQHEVLRWNECRARGAARSRRS